MVMLVLLMQWCKLVRKICLIDTQGNWGNILTGDRAAASSYIEARISKFGLDVVYNPKITEWQASYDGRRKEASKSSCNVSIIA